MNIDSDFKNPPSSFPNQRPPIKIEPRPLQKDEIRVWNNCIEESILKVGIPFAIGSHLFKNYFGNKKIFSLPSKLVAKDALIFVANITFGVILWSPVCYRKLQDKFFENQKKMMEEKEEGYSNRFGEGTTLTDVPNFASSSLDPKMDGPDSSFSHLDLDYDSTVSDRLMMEDVEDKAKSKIPETTYDDLRKRNRENFAKSYMAQVSTPQYSSPPTMREDPRPSSYSGPLEDKFSTNEPPRKVFKNKYGDEMES